MNDQQNNSDFNTPVEPESTTYKPFIPWWIFLVTGISLFFFGFYTLMHTSELMMWFAITFALSPAIAIYPVMRYIFAPKTGIAIGMSAIFGAVVQEIVKSQINKHFK